MPDSASTEQPPSFGYGDAWTELRGYVQEAVNDGGVIRPADLLAYMDELKRRVLAPRVAWIREMSRQYEASQKQAGAGNG